MKTVYSMNADWKFRLEENAEPAFDLYTKTGEMTGMASSGYSDDDWETVSLPHDWVVTQPFDPEGSQGFKRKGVAWYRRCFRVPDEWRGKRVFLRFDGIATRSAVVLNNMLLTKSDSAYLPLGAEITALLYYGQPNQLSVRTDNDRCEGWWYDGGGINRGVWLTVTDESRFVEDGVFVSAEKGKDKAWRVTVRAEVDRGQVGQTVEAEVLGVKVRTEASENAMLTLDVDDPPLWSLDSPALTPVTVRLVGQDGEIIDSETVPFGFREVKFDAARGCLVNGEPVKLKGVCLHGDHAGVGSAIPYELHLFRLRRLKEMGANAIRTSHNPQDPGFYRACDELGFAVMAETRHFGASPNVLDEFGTMVRRDRNHPCVFFWSIYNEEPLQCSPVGEAIARAMKRVAAEEDGTRPVSGGMNGPLECNGVVKVVDMMGANYMQYAYDEFHAAYPDMPMYGSETASYLSQRGETRTFKNETELRRSAFGRTRARVIDDVVNLYPWSATPGETWRMIAARPFVAGGFEWTGFDYRGEAIWPGVLSDFGAMDLCGFPKDSYYWNRSLWLENTLDAVRYADTEDGAAVLVYTDGDSVTVAQAGCPDVTFENDPFDPKPVPVSAAADVEIIARKNGREIGSTVLRRPESPETLRLTCESANPLMGGATPFNVCLLDGHGTLCDADEDVVFEAEGGAILGVGNGDASSHAPETGNRVRLYHGCAQVIVRAEAEKLVLTARCGRFEARAEAAVSPSETSEIPTCRPWLRIAPWRMSDVTATPPAPEQIHDMRYNWIPTAVGAPESLMMRGKQGFATFAAEFDAPRKDAVIHLTRVAGRFDLFMDGEKILDCRDDEPRAYDLPVPEDKRGCHVKLAFVFFLHGGRVTIGETYIQ